MSSRADGEDAIARSPRRPWMAKIDSMRGTWPHSEVLLDCKYKGKFVSASRRNQHASGVCSPEFPLASSGRYSRTNSMIFDLCATGGSSSPKTMAYEIAEGASKSAAESLTSVPRRWDNAVHLRLQSTKSSRWRGHHRQHARRARSPEFRCGRTDSVISAAFAVKN